MQANGKCPVCDTVSQVQPSLSGHDSSDILCPRCGEYVIGSHAKESLERALQMNNEGIKAYLSDVSVTRQTTLYIEIAKKAADRDMDVARSIISHALRKRMDKQIPLTSEILTDVLKNNSLPTPAEQANNFVAFLGKHLDSPGIFYEAYAQQNDGENIYGLLGLKVGRGERKDFAFIMTSLEEERLLNVQYDVGKTSGGQKIPLRVLLTLAGWQKFEELKRSVKESRKAFMAMEFPNPEETEYYFFQNTLLDNYLVPAAKQAGYELANTLRTEPKAGNLHARLEVEIRTARFVVAELSHSNNGAYWEAGFARGLGKPVIYMFNRTIGKSDRPHFDVGSDLYVPWEQDKPQKAADGLKAVIRSTLFAEAKMED
jgi:nucleoside 2-deoxyribosyltransferase